MQYVFDKDRVVLMDFAERERLRFPSDTPLGLRVSARSEKSRFWGIFCKIAKHIFFSYFTSTLKYSLDYDVSSADSVIYNEKYPQL